ncbi:MAG: hypothetical protein K6G09_10345 [Treponema sp.]|nr:hypothetical protein [Treponema sp.]
MKKDKEMKDNLNETASTEPKTKAPKKAKVKTSKKKSKMPEGYIGRPKPMRTKTFEFHKPTAKFYIGLVFFLLLAGFITYLAIRLINVSKITDAFIKAYQFDADNTPETFTIENDKLKMVMDTRTTQFTILQKDTEHVWYSNPPELQNDPIALTKEKNNMMSTLLVGYSTENGVSNTYDTYTYSIKRDFFEVDKKNNVISVNYTASTMEREYKYPLAIYAEEFEEYLEQLSTGDQNVLTRRCYREIDIDRLKPSDNKEELLRKYPGLEDDNLYLIFDPLNQYLKEQCESIFAKIDYSDEDYLRHHELYQEKSEKSEPAFNITVNYKLDGNKLIVDIPFDDILYKHAYPLVQLSVLPYFGAAGLEDEGFMFVPEGGGSIINFNNGKTRQNGYYADVYGWDWASDRKAVIKETRVAYPVFGESFGDSSFIAIMENGSEYAGVTAEISGKLGSYNYVRADYKMIHGEQFEVSQRNTSAQYAYEANLPEGERITQVYAFVNSPSYVDMAKEYRNYLFGNQKKVANKETPLAVEIVGAVDKVQQVLGMPKNKPYKLTSYTDAGKIINQIEDLGISNVRYKLSGFINGGIRQKMLKKVKYIKALGGKNHFNKMLDSVEETSAKVYLDASTQFSYRSTLNDGFFRYRDPARFASDEVCELQEYSPVWYGKLDSMDSYYLLRPYNIDRAADVLAKEALGNNLAGISYRENGYQLSADYNDSVGKTTSRAKAREQQVARMKEAKDNGLSVMINAGNAYAVKDADIITNLTMHGNSYAIIDRHIPFYEIALHGYKDYTGSPVNLGYENDQIILESAECGAGLYFVFMNEKEKALQETSYTEYYAACFDTWKDKLNDIYKRYDKELGVIKNSLIVDHAFISDDVTVTTYDNGYKVYVNFGYVDCNVVPGLKIPARQYKVQKVED